MKKYLSILCMSCTGTPVHNGIVGGYHRQHRNGNTNENRNSSVRR